MVNMCLHNNTRPLEELKSAMLQENMCNMDSVTIEITNVESIHTMVHVHIHS